MLGHASAVTTLTRYADLFDDDLDEVADRLEALRAASRGRVAELRADRTGPAPPRRTADRSESTGHTGTAGVETRGIEPLTPALQNRPRGGLARWAVTENPS